MIRFIITVSILYGVYVGILTSLQRSFLYHPTVHKSPADLPPKLASQGLVQWWIETPEGRTEAWFWQSPCATEVAPGAAVIFAHGNAELIDHWPTQLAPYRALGVSILWVEYRGYGRSSGVPTQASITADFVAGYDLLSAHPAVDAKRIFVHGRSLGGGVVMSLAAVRRPAAIVLESTFRSVIAMAKRMGVPMFLGRLLLGDPYDSEAILAAYDGPSLIFHGEFDEVIPFSHGQHLHDIAQKSQFIPMRCGHNDAPDDPIAYWRAIQTFLDTAGLTQACTTGAFP